MKKFLVPTFAFLWFALSLGVLTWALKWTNATPTFETYTRTERLLAGIFLLLNVITVTQVYQCRPWELFTRKRE